MTRGSKLKRGLVGRRERLEQPEQPVDPVHRLALDVGAVELHVELGPVDVGPGLLEAGRELGLLAPQRQGPQRLLGRVEQRRGPVELALHPSSSRERPLGHDDGLALAVVHGVLGEPAVDEVDEAPVPQRVHAAGRDLGDVGRPVGVHRAAGGDGDGGGDDEVDGDDVDDALGHAGELLEEAAGVADDHRLGHAEAADPARPRLGERRLDDRRPDDRDGHVAALLGEGPLAERLRVGVGVGPAEAGGAGPPGVDHALGDPVGAAATRSSRPGAGRRRRRARAGPPCGSERAWPVCGSRRRRRRGSGGRRRPRGASRRRGRTVGRRGASRGPSRAGCRRRSRSTRRRGGA